MQNERLKLCLRVLKKNFNKPKLSSMTVVEIPHNSIVIRLSTKFSAEAAVMQENSKRFVLAYSFPLLKQSTLEAVGFKVESKVCQELV